MFTASPPRDVSLYFTFMSAPVSIIVLITLSRLTLWVPSPCRASRAAVIALTEPMALRSMHGIWTSPPTGSQVRPEVVLHPDLGGVLHLFGSAAQHLGQRAGGHRAGRADLALAAHLGAGDRRGLLIDARRARRPPAGTGRRRRRRRRGRSDRVVQHRRHDPGGPVGRGGDHPAAGGVLLVDRERPQRHPVHHARAGRARGSLAELRVQVGCAPPHPQPAGQGAFGGAAAGHALGHHPPDRQQSGPHLGLGAPGALVGEHHVADRPAGCRAGGEQFGAGAERIGHGGRIRRSARPAGAVVVQHEPAADRVVRPFASSTSVPAYAVKVIPLG